jgi:hypothetical protein
MGLCYNNLYLIETRETKMTKTEKREQLLNDTLAFVLAGGEITSVKPKKITIKTPCRGKTANSFITGGSCPTSKISSLYHSTF